jgi:hypothetical protein
MWFGVWPEGPNRTRSGFGVRKNRLPNCTAPDRGNPRYPIWHSLAQDYLAVSASSVASERAFSSAGITISKRRSCLNADIVEALQCLKSLISREDLVLRSYPSLADEEVTMDNTD